MRKEWLEKDYYATLGVSKTASSKEIKKAFRKLAREFHPDNNPDDAAAEARFKEISEAHTVIGDAETRKQYDEAREMFSRGTFVGGPGGGAQYVRIDDMGDLGDLLGGGTFGGLGDLFGVGGRGRVDGGDGVEIEARVVRSRRPDHVVGGDDPHVARPAEAHVGEIVGVAARSLRQDDLRLRQADEVAVEIGDKPGKLLRGIALRVDADKYKADIGIDVLQPVGNGV